MRTSYLFAAHKLLFELSITQDARYCIKNRSRSHKGEQKNLDLLVVSCIFLDGIIKEVGEDQRHPTTRVDHNIQNVTDI